MMLNDQVIGNVNINFFFCVTMEMIAKGERGTPDT